MFTRQLTRTSAALAFGLLLAACGGGGSGSSGTATIPTPTATGTLLDATVVGASYKTSSGYTGTTDSLGQFKYSPGDTVTFTAAGVTLGSAAPVVASDGSSTVTPVDLVPGATGVTDPKVSAIAVFLSSLNTVSAGTGKGQSGVFVIPDDASLVGKLQQLGTSIVNITSSQIQAVLDQLYGAGKYTVTSTSDAQAGLNQGINSQGVVGTVWSGLCTCGGGGTFYFQPNGMLTGFTTEGRLLSGNWSGSPTASGGVQISLLSSEGGYTKNGVIPAGASSGTATVYRSDGTINGIFTFTKVTASTALANSLYFGGWYAALTPNAAAAAAGNKGGTAYFIVAPDGTFKGITDGNATPFQGTWTIANGTGTTTFMNADGAWTVTIDLAAKTGTVSRNGLVQGSLALSRTGTLTRLGGSSTANPIPLLLNVTVSWANAGPSVYSLALSLTVKDGTGATVAGGFKSLSTPLNTSRIRTTTTDNIAVSYPTGMGKSYALSVGPSNCTITPPNGSVVDANSGNASAYPTVNILCN